MNITKEQKEVFDKEVYLFFLFIWRLSDANLGKNIATLNKLRFLIAGSGIEPLTSGL